MARTKQTARKYIIAARSQLHLASSLALRIVAIFGVAL